MAYEMVKLKSLVSNGGIFTDGDWIESKDQDENGNIRLIQMSDIGINLFKNKSRKYINEETYKKLKCTEILEGDILISRMPDPIGRACIFNGIKNKSITAVDITILRVDNFRVSNKWLMYRINYNDISKYIEFNSTGATRKRISRKKLGDIQIPLPPLDLQIKIANALDKAQLLIDKRKEQIEALDEFLKSLFLDMFGDPVTNPKGWEVKKLKEIGKVVTGNTPSRKDPNNYGQFIEWIKSDNINTPYTYLTKADEFLSEKGKEKGRVVPVNSILVTCIAGSLSCIGNVAITDREVTFNQQINAIIPYELLNYFYTYWLIKINKKYIQDSSTKGMKGMISKGVFQELEFIFPPLPLQEEFASIVEKVESEKVKLQTGLTELENNFNSIMQKAFRGELF